MEAPCGPFVTSSPSPLGRHSPSHLGPPWSQPALRSGSSGLSPWKPSSCAGSLGLQGSLNRRGSYGPRVCVCVWRGPRGWQLGVDPVPVRGVGPCHFGRTPSDPSLAIQPQRCLGEGMRGPVINQTSHCQGKTASLCPALYPMPMPVLLTHGCLPPPEPRCKAFLCLRKASLTGLAWLGPAGFSTPALQQAMSVEQLCPVACGARLPPKGQPQDPGSRPEPQAERKGKWWERNGLFAPSRTPPLLQNTAQWSPQ